MKSFLHWAAIPVCGLLGGLFGWFALSRLVYRCVPSTLMQRLMQEHPTHDSGDGFGNFFGILLVEGARMGFALGIGMMAGTILGFFYGATLMRHWKQQAASIQPASQTNAA